MDIYVDYRNYSFDIRTDAVAPGANKATVNDLQTVIMGARIQF